MDQNPTAVSQPVDHYDAPQVERVLTADDLVREVQYAGAASSDLLVDGAG